MDRITASVEFVKEDAYHNSQELSHCSLQVCHEVQNNAEDDHCHETYRYVDQSEREGLREWMVHRHFHMSVHNRPRTKQSRNLRHAGKNAKEEREKENTTSTEIV